MKTDHDFMQAALEQARKSYDEGGVPIGSVLVKNGEIVGAGHNCRVQKSSAILHGEMAALEQTGRKPGSWYKDVTIYTTLSPCNMCTGAIVLYGIPRVVIGENTSYIGGEDILAQKGVEFTVLDDADCKALFNRFMHESPELWNEDIGI